MNCCQRAGASDLVTDLTTGVTGCACDVEAIKKLNEDKTTWGPIALN